MSGESQERSLVVWRDPLAAFKQDAYLPQGRCSEQEMKAIWTSLRSLFERHEAQIPSHPIGRPVTTDTPATSFIPRRIPLPSPIQLSIAGTPSTAATLPVDDHDPSLVSFSFRGPAVAHAEDLVTLQPAACEGGDALELNEHGPMDSTGQDCEGDHDTQTSSDMEVEDITQALPAKAAHQPKEAIFSQTGPATAKGSGIEPDESSSEESPIACDMHDRLAPLVDAQDGKDPRRPTAQGTQTPLTEDDQSLSISSSALQEDNVDSQRNIATVTALKPANTSCQGEAADRGAIVPTEEATHGEGSMSEKEGNINRSEERRSAASTVQMPEQAEMEDSDAARTGHEARSPLAAGQHKDACGKIATTYRTPPATEIGLLPVVQAAGTVCMEEDDATKRDAPPVAPTEATSGLLAHVIPGRDILRIDSNYMEELGDASLSSQDEESHKCTAASSAGSNTDTSVTSTATTAPDQPTPVEEADLIRPNTSAAASEHACDAAGNEQGGDQPAEEGEVAGEKPWRIEEKEQPLPPEVQRRPSPVPCSSEKQVTEVPSSSREDEAHGIQADMSYQAQPGLLESNTTDIDIRSTTTETVANAARKAVERTWSPIPALPTTSNESSTDATCTDLGNGCVTDDMTEIHPPSLGPQTPSTKRKAPADLCGDKSKDDDQSNASKRLRKNDSAHASPGMSNQSPQSLGAQPDIHAAVTQATERLAEGHSPTDSDRSTPTRELEVQVASEVEEPLLPSPKSAYPSAPPWPQHETVENEAKGQWRVGRLPGHQGSHIRRKDDGSTGSPGQQKRSASQMGGQDANTILKKPFRLPAKVTLAPAKTTPKRTVSPAALQESSPNDAFQTPQAERQPVHIPPRPSKPIKTFEIPRPASPDRGPSPTFSSIQPPKPRTVKRSFVPLALRPTKSTQSPQEQPRSLQKPDATPETPPHTSTTSSMQPSSASSTSSSLPASSPIASSRASRPFRLPFTRSTAPSPMTALKPSTSTSSSRNRSMTLRERIMDLEKQERTLKQALRYLSNPEEDERLEELVVKWKAGGRDVAELLFDVTPKPDAEAQAGPRRSGWSSYDDGGAMGGESGLTEEQLEYLANAPTNEKGQPLDMEGNLVFGQVDELDLGNWSGGKSPLAPSASSYTANVYAEGTAIRPHIDVWDIGTMLEKIGVDDPTLFEWDAEKEDWKQPEDGDDDLPC